MDCGGEKRMSDKQKQPDKRKRLGKRGEDAACDYLARRGFEILDRNWKCGYGEADIIALDRETLVFCEVKTRQTTADVLPEESITRKKQERYGKIASVYRSRIAVRHRSLRFDVITIQVDAKEKGARLRYLPGAFMMG